MLLCCVNLDGHGTGTKPPNSFSSVAQAATWSSRNASAKVSRELVEIWNGLRKGLVLFPAVDLIFLFNQRVSNCAEKCYQKSVEMTVLKTEIDFREPNVRMFLKIYPGKFQGSYNDTSGSGNSSVNISSELYDKLSQNTAEVVVSVERAHVKRMETMLLISTSTIVSNIGRLIGMWIGLSTVSLLDFIEHLFVKLISGKWV